MGTRREWDGNGTVTRMGRDGKGTGQKMNGTEDCDVLGRYGDGERDRDTKRMGIGDRDRVMDGHAYDGLLDYRASRFY